MASELATDFLVNKTVYFLVRSPSQQIWNGAAFENYTTANYANYPVTATEQGTASGYYVGNMPVVAAGVYAIISKQQVGGSPAESDITIGTGTLLWDGTSIQNIASIVAALLETDISGTIENAAAVHSMATVILKMTSRFDLTNAEVTATTYKTDGITAKMNQAITKNSTLTPVQQLGVGS